MSDGILTLREAAKLALDAFEYHTAQTRTIARTEAATAALRAALAVPDEPLAWQITYRSVGGTCARVLSGHNAIADYRELDKNAVSIPLYAAPPPSPVEPAKPLTDERINEIAECFNTGRAQGDYEFARAIESAHGIHGAKE